MVTGGIWFPGMEGDGQRAHDGERKEFHNPERIEKKADSRKERQKANKARGLRDKGRSK